MEEIKIGGKPVGKNNPVFIIAEAGVNHNGDVGLAKKLVAAAKDAGADAVKFQTWITEEVMMKNVEKPSYQKETTGDEETQFDMVKKLELTDDETREVAAYAKEIGITFLSTPEGKHCVDLLEDIGAPAFKVGSGDLDNYPHLKYVAGKNKPIILSTGMATMEDVEDSVNFLRACGNNQIILLHCTTSYPAKLSEVNLNSMLAMEKFGLPVGYSDHTEEITVPVFAVSVGACVIEKHFTLDRNFPGPDHKASLEPNELKEMVYRIKNFEPGSFEIDEKERKMIMGSSNKCPTVSEKELEHLVKKYVVAGVDIKEGSVITENMLAVKRTGGAGLSPRKFFDIVDRKAAQKIKRNEPIEWGMIE